MNVTIYTANQSNSRQRRIEREQCSNTETDGEVWKRAKGAKTLIFASGSVEQRVS